MATVSFQRPLAVSTAATTADLDTGFIIEDTSKYYLPLTFNNFAAPNIVSTGITAVTGETKISCVAPLTGVAGQLDNIRVGDIVVSGTGAFALTAKSTFTRTCSTFQGMPFIIYAHTFTSSTLNVKAGDAITGTGIPASTFVDKIDYATRRIFLTANATATGSDVMTFQPPVRVTAVRKSTATAFPNEIDIDSTIGTGATGVSVTFQVGLTEAAHNILKIEPISNTTGSRVSFSVSVSPTLPETLVPGNSGISDSSVTTLNYITVGTFGVDADAFFTKARLPQV